MAGYPVHNYGTEALDYIADDMAKSNLASEDWKRKSQLLERKAMSDAVNAKQSRNATMQTELMKAGGLPKGAATESGLWEPSVAQGMEVESDRQKGIEELKSSKLRAETAQKQAENNAKENEEDEKHLKGALKRWKRADLSGDVEGRTIANDDISFFLNRQATRLKRPPLSVDQFVNGSEYDDWVEDAKLANLNTLSAQVTAMAAKIADGNGKVTDLVPLHAAAQKEIAIYERQSGVKDSAARFQKQIDDAHGLVTKAAEEKGKAGTITEKDKELADELARRGLQNTDVNRAVVREELSKRTTPTDADKTVSDRMAAMKLPPTEANRDKVRTILLKEKASVEKDTGKYQDFINYNKDLVKQGQKPITYTYYVDNIASKFDLGKALFGGGVNSPEEGTKHYPEGKEATTPKKEVTSAAGGAKDKFGYKMGQTLDKNGIKYQYIGNDQWKKL